MSRPAAPIACSHLLPARKSPFFPQAYTPRPTPLTNPLSADPLPQADSEHSAIFQCIQGLPEGGLRRIILTASGGAFRDWATEARGKRGGRWEGGLRGLLPAFFVRGFSV